MITVWEVWFYFTKCAQARHMRYIKLLVDVGQTEGYLDPLRNNQFGSTEAQ